MLGRLAFLAFPAAAKPASGRTPRRVPVHMEVREPSFSQRRTQSRKGEGRVPLNDAAPADQRSDTDPGLLGRLVVFVLDRPCIGRVTFARLRGDALVVQRVRLTASSGGRNTNWSLLTISTSSSARCLAGARVSMKRNLTMRSGMLS